MTSLKIDLSFYGSYPLRKYELNCLSIVASEPTRADCLRLRLSCNRRFPSLRKLAEFATAGGSFIVLTDGQNGFDEAALAQRGNIYLEGFWQSWKYFSGIRPVLLKEFAVSLPCDTWNTAMMAHIQQSNSVCIHIRRGDYVQNRETAEIFGACAVEYYLEAIEQCRGRLANPEFFVFSDDLKWAKANLGELNEFVYLDHNRNQPPAADLRLMQQCRHFILSNSTFGWWAAWLSEASDKMVISPRNWYKTDWPTHDLLPPEWITLPNALL